ncbi:aldo/keto reductase [Pseudoxanthomonas indica]|uniref:Predicted oxidoreductase n=1 Tax=Pseudoxanthomonas indica TaxID=428993 RepID=A0A1T5LSX0_9GAMM|nr:aldo/keto reductase [Pseudoxanthomonas indica]GGD38992.1 oxidoreductase [Pseudoxanthomonas indica]SKC78915.1 Predicted oxidoreductase [Pseudoxanthomonas indica]
MPACSLRVATMQTFAIPGTHLRASRIAVGCMHLSRAWDNSPLTEAERLQTRALVDTALERGITLFDHADIYARGKSERLFGEVLAASPSLRDSMVLQSKCGIRFAHEPHASSPGRYDFSHAHLISSVEGSLQRLQTDRLDLLLLHRPDPLGHPDEVARAFDDLQRSGKVLHFGVSNHTGAQIALLQKSVAQPLVVNQVEISLLHHHLINEGVVAAIPGTPYTASAGTLDYCRQHDILVQAWSPLAGGRLSHPETAEPGLRPTAERVAHFASKYGVSAEAILLAWLLRHPAGIQPIVGTTQAERLLAASAADVIELDREDWYDLFTAARGAPVP